MKRKLHPHLDWIVGGAMRTTVIAAACLLVPTAVGGAQDVAPGFAPGSIPDQPFSLLNESSAEAWNPPVTDAQPSSSPWVPPDSPVQVQPSPSDADIQVDTPESSPVELPAESNILVAPSDPEEDLSPQESTIELPPTDDLSTDDVPVIPETTESIPQEANVEVQQPDAATGSTPAPEQAESESGEPVTALDSDSEAMLAMEQAALADSTALPLAVQGCDAGCETGLPLGSDQQTPGTASRTTKLPFNTPVRNMLGGLTSRLAGNGDVYAVGQLTLLSFARDYRQKGRLLSNGGPNLLANGPDEGDFTGVDISYGRRRAGGQGWEMRYIGFDPDQATDVSAGATLAWGGLTSPLNDPATWGGAIPAGIPETFGLSGIGTATISMADVFDVARNHQVSRDSEFGSFEFNLLRAAVRGSQLTCGKANVEFFGGLRGVAFNETTIFTAGATRGTALPRSAFYSSEVENSLFGLQIGGRLERQLQRGWGYTFGTRVGIYNNRVESRQRAAFQFDDGSTAIPQILYGNDVGREFDFTDKDNELAFLGELDFGLIYHFRPRTRARFGYRGIAVTNVADAAGQFEDQLFNVTAVSEPKAYTDFIVGGLYFGVDHAF